MIKLTPIKIWAYGNHTRIVWIRFHGDGNDFVKGFRINNGTYQILRNAGIPTSQFLRSND